MSASDFLVRSYSGMYELEPLTQWARSYAEESLWMQRRNGAKILLEPDEVGPVVEVILEKGGSVRAS